MENNIPQITFAIASKNNFRYIKYAIKYIRENCHRTDHIIHIGIDGVDDELKAYYKNDVNVVISDNVSGIAAIYNDIVKKSTTDFVIIYHADMIAGKDMDINLYKHWKKGLIISATRIEPPLHPSDPSKIIKNFGLWPEDDVVDGFLSNEFNNFVHSQLNNTTITHGVFAPWLIHRDDYLSIGGHDESLNSHSEDRDLFNRFLLAGFNFIQPWNSLVYHLTCRGGQFQYAIKTNDLAQRSNDWNQLALVNTREFIRKWKGAPAYDNYQYPVIQPRYQLVANILNITYELLYAIEPLFSKMVINNDELIQRYIYNEQSNTSHKLSTKLVSKLNDVPDILITFDATNLNSNNYQILYDIQKILYDSGEIGEFELDIFKISINGLVDTSSELILCNN